MVEPVYIYRAVGVDVQDGDEAKEILVADTPSLDDAREGAQNALRNADPPYDRVEVQRSERPRPPVWEVVEP